MAVNEHNFGDTRRLKMTSASLSQVPTDPDSATFRLTRPDGTKVTHTWPTPGTTLKKDTTGVLYVDWTMDATGLHTWGGNVVVGGISVEEEERKFHVKPRES